MYREEERPAVGGVDRLVHRVDDFSERSPRAQHFGACVVRRAGDRRGTVEVLVDIADGDGQSCCDHVGWL